MAKCKYEVALDDLVNIVEVVMQQLDETMDDIEDDGILMQLNESYRILNAAWTRAYWKTGNDKEFENG